MSDVKAQIAHQIYRAAENLGASIELLSILGSYGDTLNDDDILSMLTDYNEGKKMNVICSVYSDGETMN